MPDKNTFEAEQYLQAMRREVFGAVAYLGKIMEEPMADGVQLLQVTVQSPVKTGGDYRAVLKGRDEKGGLWVAFVNGGSVAELHSAIAREGQSRGFKWREDKPFVPKE